MTRQVSSRVSLKFSEMIRAPFVFTLLFLLRNSRGIAVKRQERSYRAGCRLEDRGRQPGYHSLQFASDPAMILRDRQPGGGVPWRAPIRHGPAVPVVWCSPDKPTLTIPIIPAVSGVKKCRQCNGLSQSLANRIQEFMGVGRLLEERQRPGVQSPFLIVSRISGAENDDWSSHKIL